MAEFAEAVASMRGGAADRAASTALAKVVEAVRATGKGGAVTLKIGIKPLKDGDGELEISAKIGISLPAEDIKTAIYYATEDNKLIRTDPRQMSLIHEGNDRGTAVARQQEGDLNRVGRGNVTVIDGDSRRA
ncbi:hypothetical protein ABIB86_000470 [Bradyrhizobium sp. JR1.7]|uniref:hypothetical protein n=1 Tax=unclassified Bradyrhizobium TaxID=2631580 RepID=UPI00339609F8